MVRASLEYAMHYAKERVAFGRPIVSYQGIAFLVAEMAMKLDAARLVLWRAAASWDRGAEIDTFVLEAGTAQHQPIEIAKSATIHTVHILAGPRFIHHHPV